MLTEEQKQEIRDQSAKLRKLQEVIYRPKGYGKTTRPKNYKAKKKARRKRAKLSKRRNRK